MKSKKILSKDAKVGGVYVTRGGVTTDEHGTQHVWGFARVRILECGEKYVKVATPWDTKCELPLDYSLYTTTENEVKVNSTLVRNRDRSSTIELAFQEAIDQGFESMSSSRSVRKKSTLIEKEQRQQRALALLTSKNGTTVRTIANELNIPYQSAYLLFRKLVKLHGYTMVKNGHTVKLIKVK